MKMRTLLVTISLLAPTVVTGCLVEDPAGTEDSWSPSVEGLPLPPEPPEGTHSVLILTFYNNSHTPEPEREFALAPGAPAAGGFLRVFLGDPEIYRPGELDTNDTRSPSRDGVGSADAPSEEEMEEDRVPQRAQAGDIIRLPPDRDELRYEFQLNESGQTWFFVDGERNPVMSTLVTHGDAPGPSDCDRVYKRADQPVIVWGVDENVTLPIEFGIRCRDRDVA